MHVDVDSLFHYVLIEPIQSSIDETNTSLDHNSVAPIPSIHFSEAVHATRGYHQNLAGRSYQSREGQKGYSG